ncbi:hypothetical protein [Jiella sp. M17.18]|uniref:phage protein n=1 Tax=Jiella sp. M17.18 TaxID=3234247 RepID=UPI0034DE0800
MSRQWIRACKLTVEGENGVIDLSEMRIRFSVTQHTLQTPNALDARITNLSDDTVSRIQGEGKSVSLEAGYQDGYGLIFRGLIIQKRKGRENPVDTYLDILAQGGDTAYNFALVKKTLAAGHTFRDQVDAALEAMKPYGITAGYITDLGSKKMPRARVLFGMARDVLRTVAFSTGTSWSIQNDQLVITKDAETLPGAAIVLNSRTGMIGLPEQTDLGIQVTCLLNPQIRPSSRIQINQKDIQQAKLSADYLGVVNNAQIPPLADDGFYKVWTVSHAGDTRGDPWYTTAICTRADGKGQIPTGLVSKGIEVAQ